MKKLLLILLFVFVFIITGCQEPEVQEKLISITVNGSDKLYIGDEATYETVFNPDNYSNKEVTWSSSDETKLIIDQETGVASALDETKEEGVFVYATSIDQPNIKGSKKIFIYKPESYEPVYPDLQGYTITIAHSLTNLGDIDPFSNLYGGSDKIAKQEAWREVEKDFNCKIEVRPYPSSAEWGPSRWDYILAQAENKTSDFDFLIVPDSQIYHFASAKAIMSLEDFYVLHGNNMMDKTFIESGTYENELYTFAPGMNNIYYALYYNIILFNKLKEVNPNLIEPAQIFLDGNWTHSKFLEYCIEVQDTLALLYGDKGTAGSETQEYYALTGWDTYLWAGLSSNVNEPISDIKNSKINIITDQKEQAANIVKELYTKHYANPQQSLGYSAYSWSYGEAFFNTAMSLRDVHLGNIEDFGNKVEYGYVPWPRANDVAFEDIQVALDGSGNSFVMPIGKNYEGYGEECNPENIYWALTEVYRRTMEKMNEDDSLTESKVQYNANKVAESEASQNAYIYINNLIKSGNAYFDPLSQPGNVIDSLSQQLSTGNSYINTTIKGGFKKYINGEYATWKETVEAMGLEDILKEALEKGFKY